MKVLETELWEILVPTVRRDNGRPIRTRFHKVWDKKVREITGGVTILKPAKGQWISPDGKLFEERMIPVRIACDEKTMREKIAPLTLTYYDQLAIFFSRVSDKVCILEK